MKKCMKEMVLGLSMILTVGMTNVYAEQQVAPDLTGDWQLTYSYGGMPIANQSVTVSGDNTFEAVDEDESVTGSWSFDGETLVLSSDGEDIALVWDDESGQLMGEYSGMNVTMSRSTSLQDDDMSAQEVDSGMLAGGWETAEDPAITDDINNKFQLALDSYQTGAITIAYTPVAYLGSQVVAGTNHAILCRASEINKGSKWVIIYLYEDLQGETTVMNIADFDFGSLCTYGVE